MPVIIIPIFAIIIVVAIVLSLVAAAKRKKELALLAARLGLRFAEKDVFDLPERHSGMAAFSTGHSQRAYNQMYGEAEGYRFVLTDYAYTVGGGKNSHTYNLTYCLLYSGMAMGCLQVRPENFSDKIAAFVGFDDINFESAEFNSAYYVRADDKRFAYDIIHPKMMEYLLHCTDLQMEICGEVILVHFGKKLPVEAIEPLLHTTRGIADLLPSYL